MTDTIAPGDSDLVRTGPGRLYAGPYGTALPATPVATLDTALRPIGFTIDGHDFNYAQTNATVDVAERLIPVRNIITGVAVSWSFNAAEMTCANLALATNAPSTAIVTAGGYTTFSFPKAGGTGRVSLVWISDDNLEMFVLAKVFAGGTIAVPFKKGSTPRSVAMTFTVEDNSDNTIMGGANVNYVVQAALETAGAGLGG